MEGVGGEGGREREKSTWPSEQYHPINLPLPPIFNKVAEGIQC